MTSRPDERRWTLAVRPEPDYNRGDQTPGYRPLVVDGPKMQRGESVEVIPLAAHEAALAAARQVDVTELVEIVNSRLTARELAPGFTGDVDLTRTARRLHAMNIVAAILAALNAPEPASEKPPRNPKHLEAEAEDPSVVDALVRVTSQLARLREAAQGLSDEVEFGLDLSDAHTLTRAGDNEYVTCKRSGWEWRKLAEKHAALRAALASTNESDDRQEQT